MTTAPSPSERVRRPFLLGWLSALALLEVLNLIVFDDLRTNPNATFVGTFTKPQHLSAIVGTVLAAVLVGRGYRWATRLAAWVAGLVALGFVLFHAIPVKAGPIKPYWGPGSADAGQWLGTLLIWACCAMVILAARPHSRARPQV